MTFYFYTLGCKVNQYETNAMMEMVRAAGYEAVVFPAGFAEAGSGVMVVNSCTVTGESDRKLRSLLRRCRRDNPKAILVVCGCMPQSHPNPAQVLPEADIILGNASRRSLVSLVEQFRESRRAIVDIPVHGRQTEPMMVGCFEGRIRAFVKIEDGCNQFCSYCIIPHARGRVRSRPLDELSAEVKALSDAGYAETVLVGINLTAYGSDCGMTLADAAEAAAASGIRRLRLGSLEPDRMTDALIARLAAIPVLCPQFHLSLQSGCDATLRRMNRPYSTAEFAMVCEKLRRSFPGCAITSDIMVGFPGEDESEFQQSVDFVASAGLARGHIFAYSRRPGTPAATASGQIAAAEKKRRSRIMAEICGRTRADYEMSRLQSTTQVLVETVRKDGLREGYTKEYIPVRFDAALPTGAIADVRLTGRTQEYMTGMIM